MIDKTLASCAEAVAQVFDGATVMIGGFGGPGYPAQLCEALRKQGARDLVVVSNGAGNDDWGLGGLIQDGRVRKLICSFPNYPTATAFRERFLKDELELELLPQGTLVERIRAAGAGLGGLYTPTAVGTELAEGKEVRVINGREYVFELPLHADFAFIKAHRGDRFGNLTYRRAMRNFNMIMATAAQTVLAEVDELVAAGGLSPEEIHTPGIFVDRLVRVERHPLLFVPAKEVNAQ
jgi:3-oxoadipate CoA-transferase alpha subunit